MLAWEGVRFWLSVATISATIIGVAVGRYPFLRMNRATIALTGATALIALGALSLEEAYAAASQHRQGLQRRVVEMEMYV